ncbi:MAG: hypothetical protein QXN96_00930 [Candidatus Bathyarchaeia archaeon]
MDEFYRVAFQAQVYLSINELHEEMGYWLRQYNEEWSYLWYMKILLWEGADADVS